MIRILLLLVTCMPGMLCGQTLISQSFEVSSAGQIVLNLKYPELIKIRTWDKNEILIKGNIIINNGENDDAFSVTGNIEQGAYVISADIQNLENLPKKITINRDGMSYFFNTDNFKDSEVQKFMREEGGSYSYSSYGVIREITLDIMVPEALPLTVNAEYGLVDVEEMKAPLEVNAKYGGIDVMLPENSRHDMTARTRHGEIYTNLNAEFDHNDDGIFSPDRWTIISTRLNGGGTKYNLESKFGNIYLRGKK